MAHRYQGFWANSLRQNWPAYFIVLIIFALGFTAGILGVQKLQVNEAQELSLYLDRFMEQAALIDTDPVGSFGSVLYNDLIVIAAVYLLGLTIIGIPIILGLIFTRGFVLGFSIFFLGWEKNIQGIILSCAAILPQNIIFIPALLLGGIASLSFALLLGRRFLNSKVLIWPSFIVYSILMFLLAVLAFVAGLVEVHLTPFLVKLAANFLF